MCKKLSKKNVLKWMDRIGKSSFFTLVVTQTIVLARYPSIYWESEWFNVMLLLMLPTLVVWWYGNKIIKKWKQPIERLWLVWLLYVFFLLIPMTGMIFGGLRSKLDSDYFFGPNILRMSMCLTPAIAFLLFITTTGARKNSELIAALCGNIALDLFDDIEVLAILLPQSESVHLPDGIAGSIIAFVCLSLLLSALEIGENKLVEEGKFKNQKRLYLLRLSLQIAVNFSLLVIRLVVWLKYKHDASIFIAKNMIIIVIAISIIIWQHWDTEEERKEKPKQKVNTTI